MLRLPQGRVEAGGNSVKSLKLLSLPPVDLCLVVIPSIRYLLPYEHQTYEELEAQNGVDGQMRRVF